ncbi:MAG: alpha/beta hydrolase family protein [Vicinamibacteria bacterium]
MDFEEGSSKIPVEMEGTALGQVSIIVSRPKSFRLALALAHGAGGNLHSPLLKELARGLAGEGIAAARFNFLYSESKKRTPDRQPQLLACWRSVADWLKRELKTDLLFLGGKSMGGRMASYLASEGYPCAGLVFLGYPLHPPGDTVRLRKAHLPSISVPMLFIAGTRDPLSRFDLLEATLEEIGELASLHVIEGGDHSFKVPKASGRSPAEITAEILSVTTRWLSSVSQRVG